MSQITQKTTNIRSKLVIDAYSQWIKKNEKVLDVGCGDGILAQILQERFSINITGCDIDNYLQKVIPFMYMKSRNLLPFSNKSFDIVMFNDTLHHMSFLDQEKLLKESLRVAKKVLIFEDEPTLIGSFTDWTINKFHSLNMPVTLTFRTHSAWTALFTKMKLTYEFRQIPKPFFYPFHHQSFMLHQIKNNSGNSQINK